MKIQVYSDGGSRGNPGLAAIGFVLKAEDTVIYEYGEPIGIATNNIAEYRAALEGIRTAKKFGFDRIELKLDSQLVERQLKGVYRVKSEELLPLFLDIKSEVSSLKSFEVNHIRREFNKIADGLVNQALDDNRKIIWDRREGVQNENGTMEVSPSELNQSVEGVLKEYHVGSHSFQIEGGCLLIKLDQKEQDIFLGNGREILVKLKKLNLSKVCIEVEI